MRRQKRQPITTLQLTTPALPPDDHAYSKVLTGTFTPSRGSAADWALAKPIAQQLLLEDFAKGLPRSQGRESNGRLSALCLYLNWLADIDPALLVKDPMDRDQIRLYLATDGITRRSSHRSRVALRSTLNSFNPIHKARVVLGPIPTIAPTDDHLFDQAMRVVENFRNPETRANSRALLLLCRATGVTGNELRYIAGDDVIKIAMAGTWLIVRAPGHEREIPVLKRFQKDLEDLALASGSRPMVSRSGSIPIDSSKAGEVAGTITRELKRSKIPGLIQTGGLRKAWLAEQVASNAPLLTLLKATGLTSLNSINDLLAEHAPLPSTNKQHIAYELGGTE
jgi:hypothetical protein